MITVSITDLKKRKSHYFRLAEYGEAILVTRYGKPIVEIAPKRKSKIEIFDSLIGVAKGVDPVAAKEERLALL